MFTNLLKNIIYWLSAFPVPALSMLSSLSFSFQLLLVVYQGQDLSLWRRSWPCCIFIERTECLKKKKQHWGWKLQIVYWFLYVLLSKSVWALGPSVGFCLGHSISPMHACDRYTRCHAWPGTGLNKAIYRHVCIFIYHQGRLMSEVNCENGAALSPLLV